MNTDPKTRFAASDRRHRIGIASSRKNGILAALQNILGAAAVFSAFMAIDRTELWAVDYFCDGRAGVLGVQIEGAYNPRATNGLLAVASLSGDYSRGEGDFATFDAAVYGSDSCWTWLVDPHLVGLAIEPMANVQTHAFHPGGVTGISVEGEARMAVLHRAIGLSAPPDMESTLKAIANVQVKVHVSLHVSAQAPIYSALADAVATVRDQSGGVLTNIAIGLDYFSFPGGELTIETNVVANLQFRRSQGVQHELYEISVYAYAGAQGQNGETAEAQAIADPLVEVDPEWEYAPYFAVVQESIQRPGQWIEITRAWQNTMVRPTLTLTRSISTMLLSWPSNLGDYELRTTTNLVPPVVWSVVTNSPVLTTSAQWQVALSHTAESHCFFQLHDIVWTEEATPLKVCARQAQKLKGQSAKRTNRRRRSSASIPA